MPRPQLEREHRRSLRHGRERHVGLYGLVREHAVLDFGAAERFAQRHLDRVARRAVVGAPATVADRDIDAGR